MAGAVVSCPPATSPIFRPPPRERLRTPAVAGTTGERLVDHIAASRILPACAKGLLIHANRGMGRGQGMGARPATLRQAFVHPSRWANARQQLEHLTNGLGVSPRARPPPPLKLRGPTENFTRRGEGP